MNAEPVPSPGPVRRPAPAATGNPIVPPQHTLLKSAWLAVLLGLAVEGAVLLTVAAFGGALAAKPATARSRAEALLVGHGLRGTGARPYRRPRERAAHGPRRAPRGAGGVRHRARPAQGGCAGARPRRGGRHDRPLAARHRVVPRDRVRAPRIRDQLAVAQELGGVGAHAIAGFAAGLLFGVPLVVLAVQAMPQMGGLAIAARLTNELIFPLGCALVLYASDTLGKRLGG
ncbi:MAG: hypothetical protein R2862_04045 [Thermoanaerobaculia bacterium]